MDDLERLAKADRHREEYKRRQNLLAKGAKCRICQFGAPCGMLPDVDTYGHFTIEGFCTVAHRDLCEEFLKNDGRLEEYLLDLELKALKDSIIKKVENMVDRFGSRLVHKRLQRFAK